MSPRLNPNLLALLGFAGFIALLIHDAIVY